MTIDEMRKSLIADYHDLEDVATEAADSEILSLIDLREGLHSSFTTQCRLEDKFFAIIKKVKNRLKKGAKES